MNDSNAKDFQTDYSKRLSQAAKFEYALPFAEWPKHLVEEWNGLFLLRTDPLTASLKWDLNLENVPKKKRFHWRVRKQDGHCPSAAKQKQELEWFFGWCQLPIVKLPDGTKNLWRSGPDVPRLKEDFSLSFVTDLELIEGYIAFRKAHTILEANVKAGEVGVFNKSCYGFLEFTSSLLNPLTGFISLRKDLYFRPDDKIPSPQNIAHRVGYDFYDGELRKKVVEKDPDKRWLYFCKKIRAYMEVTKKDKFDKTLMTRGWAPIQKILDLDDPMEAIAELLIALQNSEPVIEYWRHFHRRKMLFFAMISVAPLRILQFAFMSSRHLVKIDDKAEEKPFYQIHFSRDEFKNERFIQEQDYFLDLPCELTEFIDNYKMNDWPALNGRTFQPGDRIFATGMSELEKGGVTPNRKELNDTIISQLSKVCREATARHLGKKYRSPGFYAQAIRHIIATAIVKNTGSYEQAALVLWDAIETVRETYAHVKRRDQLAKATSESYSRLKGAMAGMAK